MVVPLNIESSVLQHREAFGDLILNLLGKLQTELSWYDWLEVLYTAAHASFIFKHESLSKFTHYGYGEENLKVFLLQEQVVPYSDYILHFKILGEEISKPWDHMHFWVKIISLQVGPQLRILKSNYPFVKNNFIQ